jgi:glycosyltransferase involved in cell wall biosynthesis
VPKTTKCFHILYPGVIDAENRNPKALLRGVRKALDMGWLREDDLQITFLGAGPYGSTLQFTRDVSETRLERQVSVVVERIPYSDALCRMAGANVVVVLSEHLTQGDERTIQDWTAMQVPVKLYEYLRLGRPLLALVSEGAVKELLDQTGAGVPIPPWDSERVAAALKRHYEERRPPPTHLPRASDAVAVYSRERLTSLLARELDAVAGARRMAHALPGTGMAP